MAWTKRQLQNAMRAAGWQSVKGPGCCYEHPDGGKIYLDRYTSGRGHTWRGHIWQRYADLEQVPAPGGEIET